MNIEALLKQVTTLEEISSSQILALKADETPILIQRLKEEADRYWRIDPHMTLCFAQAIIQVGSTLNEQAVMALGTMVHGDALRHVHQNEEAWELLEKAGQLYREIGDQVGWARTRIGRLAICVEMNAIESALQDAEIARTIFQQCGELDKQIRLETNFAVVFNYLTQYRDAIEKCHEVLSLLESAAPSDQNTRIIIGFSLGYAYQGLGNLREALKWYEYIRDLMIARGETIGVAQVNLNLINIAQAQGYNKKALLLLHQTIDVIRQNHALEGGKELLHIIDCYLYFNRFSEARDLARRIIQEHPQDNENYDLALILLQLTIAETELEDFSEVDSNLQRAEHILERLNAAGWLGFIHLYRGKAALRQGHLQTALLEATTAVEQFSQNEQRLSYLMALLLVGRVEAAAGNYQTAFVQGQQAQKLSREYHIPHLRYQAYLLMGKMAETTGRLKQARRYYQVASALIERIQRSLVLTSRREFLEDKQESVQSLVRLNLGLNQPEEAFLALERAKAQVWLSYLSQLDHLRWMQDDPQNQPLIEELSHLREEHHWYYRIAYDPVFREQQHAVLPAAEAASQAKLHERRLRTLTEQLYLRTSMEDLAAIGNTSIDELQQSLPDDCVLVEYYSDGNNFWAFILDSHHLRVVSLPTPVPVVEKLLDKWQSNINRALRTLPGSANEQMLRDYSLSMAGQLYAAVMQPLAEQLTPYRRIIIVPYGILHYLPFHLLRDKQGYLLERAEVVILPSARLMQRSTPRQKRRALALAYSWDGRLQHSADEARRVIARFGGELYAENASRQSVLSASPCQVLHISAHGQYRIDQPDFSYIQLADGPLYTDDLFQHDLSYELITLSACETGRSHAAAGDELIGLGRGFLFAGAGALIASLWRVNEALTLELMDALYHQLDLGASKAAALREAQLALMRAYPGLHPAFWGAFELIGNPDPLTR